MNRLKLLLALSVALNVGFITLFVLHAASATGPQTGKTRSSQALLSTVSDVAASSIETIEEAESAPATTRGYRRLRSALRATGLPEAEIHRILRGTALADWQDDVRRIQQENRAGSAEFWRGRSLPFEMDVGSQRRAVELRRAREAALSELIGENESLDPWSIYFGEARWGIPEDRRRAVLMLEEDYELLRAETYMRGLHLPEDREALQLLYRERMEDLARILSPDELEEYELRHSDTADILRYELRFFDATEEEFRDLFRLHHALDTEFPLLASNPEQRQAAETALEEELRKLIGEDRYAEYQRVQDYEFQELADLTRRLGIPTERAVDIFDFKTLIEEQSRAVLHDDELTLEDRFEAAQMLADEARRVLREALGERGYTAYTTNGGWWLRNLEQSFPSMDEQEDP